MINILRSSRLSQNQPKLIKNTLNKPLTCLLKRWSDQQKDHKRTDFTGSGVRKRSRSLVRLLPSALSGNNSGQIVHSSHTCASVTKPYNLVPVKRWWCSLAGKVTVGLVESNGSLPPCL